MANNVIVNCTFVIDDSPGAISPMMGRDDRRNDLYWQMATVMFASARKFADDGVVLRLVVSESPPARHAERLRALGVEIRVLPWKYRPPLGFTDVHRTAWFILDAMEDAARSMGPDEVGVFVDPDCLWTGSPRVLAHSTQAQGYLLHGIGYAPDQKSCGLSRAEIAGIIEAMTGTRPDPLPAYIGGEVCAFTAEALGEFAVAVYRGWEHSLKRFERGMPHFRVEEHLFTYAAWCLGWSPSMRGLTKRIWTHHSYRNTEPEDVELILWHLPAEKKRGFPRVYGQLDDPSSAFHRLEGSAFNERFARVFGIAPCLPRRVRDWGYRRARALLGR